MLVGTYVRRLDPVCSVAMVEQSRVKLTMWRASGGEEMQSAEVEQVLRQSDTTKKIGN